MVVSLDDRDDEAVGALAAAGASPGAALRVERNDTLKMRVRCGKHVVSLIAVTQRWCALQRSYGVGGPSPRVVAAANEVLAGNRRGWRALLPFAGPAFVASVAYMDPGNFATNIQGGAAFGYRFLWVVVLPT